MIRKKLIKIYRAKKGSGSLLCWLVALLVGCFVGWLLCWLVALLVSFFVFLDAWLVCGSVSCFVGILFGKPKPVRCI